MYTNLAKHVLPHHVTSLFTVLLLIAGIVFIVRLENVVVAVVVVVVVVVVVNLFLHLSVTRILAIVVDVGHPFLQIATRVIVYARARIEVDAGMIQFDEFGLVHHEVHENLLGHVGG